MLRNFSGTEEIVKEVQDLKLVFNSMMLTCKNIFYGLYGKIRGIFLFKRYLALRYSDSMHE